MDYFKVLTIKNYTAWDLNCPSVYKPHNYSKNKQAFKRTARRKDRQSFSEILEKVLDKQEQE